MENENNKDQLMQTQSTDLALDMPATSLQPQNATMWNNKQLLQTAFSAAKYLASSELAPPTYKGHPENCLIALDVCNRTGLSPLMVMQNLFPIQGRPAWSGQMHIALVNASGRFSPLEFVFVGEPDTDDYGCFAKARRRADGMEVNGSLVTMQMAKNEGWLSKNGSKWKTMPEQMLRYRAGSFFARAYCPDVLLGIQSADEIEDVRGAQPEQHTTTISKD